MKITKKLQIGIDAVGIIKKAKSPLTTAELADVIGTTSGFLNQIMKNLTKSELVHSKYGPGGGYVLNPKKKDLSAYDVAVALNYEFAPFITRGSAVPADRLNGEIIDAFLRIKI